MLLLSDSKLLHAHISGTSDAFFVHLGTSNLLPPNCCTQRKSQPKIQQEKINKSDSVLGNDQEFGNEFDPGK